MSTTDPDYPFNVCQSLLLSAIAILDAAGRMPFDRTLIPIGSPVWEITECINQLTVHWVSGYAAAPGLIEDRSRTNDIKQVRPAMNVEIGMVRCATVFEDGMEPPEPATLTAESKQAYGDAWAMWTGLQNGRFLGTLWAPIPDVEWDPPECARVRVDPVVPAGPQGGAAGFRIPLVVGLG